MIFYERMLVTLEDVLGQKSTHQNRGKHENDIGINALRIGMVGRVQNSVKWPTLEQGQQPIDNCECCIQDHCSVHASLEDFIRGESKVEGKECLFDRPMREHVEYLFDEEPLVFVREKGE